MNFYRYEWAALFVVLVLGFFMFAANYAIGQTGTSATAASMSSQALAEVLVVVTVVVICLFAAVIALLISIKQGIDRLNSKNNKGKR